MDSSILLFSIQDLLSTSLCQILVHCHPVHLQMSWPNCPFLPRKSGSMTSMLPNSLLVMTLDMLYHKCQLEGCRRQHRRYVLILNYDQFHELPGGNHDRHHHLGLSIVLSDQRIGQHPMSSHISCLFVIRPYCIKKDSRFDE